MRRLLDDQVDAIIALYQDGVKKSDIVNRLKIDAHDVEQIISLLTRLAKIQPSNRHANKQSLAQLLDESGEVARPQRRTSWLLPLAGLVSFAMVLSLMMLTPGQKDTTTGFAPSQLSANGTPDHANNTIQAASLVEQSVAHEELDDVNLVSTDSDVVNKIGASYGEDNY